MQDSRLFKMIYYLLDNKHVTASLLAEKFEVSLRTIYRDIDMISHAGIPIYALPGRNGGIYIDEDFVLHKVLLSTNEKEEIALGLQALTASNYPNIESILTKLGMTSMSWIEIDFSRWGSDVKKEKDIFYLLKKAILEKYRISFVYYSSKERRNREIEPFKLVYKDKAWYVQGYCLYRKEERIFRVSRMKDIIISNHTFTRETQDTAFKMWEAKGPLITLELLFSKEVGYRLYDILDDCVIQATDTGYFVKMTVPDTDWIYEFLLSFGKHVTIISPVSSKEKLLGMYYQAIKNYERKEKYEN